MGPLGVTLSGVLIESTLWAVHNGFIDSDELQYGHALGPRGQGGCEGGGEGEGGHDQPAPLPAVGPLERDRGQ